MEVEDTKDILKEQMKSYNDLYWEMDTVGKDEEMNTALNTYIGPKWSQKALESIEGPHSYDEVTAVLKLTKQWEKSRIGWVLSWIFDIFLERHSILHLRLIKESYSQGCIFCSSKKGIDNMYYKKQISQENFYKIKGLFRFFNANLQQDALNWENKVLRWLINEDQKGFISDRFMGENHQSIKFLCRQYPLCSQAQWCNSQISIQKQSQWSYSITSTSGRARWCLRDQGQVKKICYETSPEGSNWGGWMYI